ncbi:MAG: hypothetical protein N3A72_04710 [bacterium]|nr:hypothetical protein [bacterium]
MKITYRNIVCLLISIVFLFSWANSARDSVQELSNRIQEQSANTQNSLLNYQLCYDISRAWWSVYEPELALDFLYAAAKEAELMNPATLSAMKLLELAKLATREYRDRSTAEEMIQRARDRMRLILDYYEWRIPYREANRIEKEAQRLQYLPRGKYIPRPVTLPVPVQRDVMPGFPPGDIVPQQAQVDRIYPTTPRPETPLNPILPPNKPDKPQKPPQLAERPDKPDKPSLPPKPPQPPDKPEKPDKPPLPPKPPDKPEVPKPPKPPDKPDNPPQPPDRPKPPQPPKPPDVPDKPKPPQLPDRPPLPPRLPSSDTTRVGN